jgi:hypothetical protein
MRLKRLFYIGLGLITQLFVCILPFKLIFTNFKPEGASPLLSVILGTILSLLLSGILQIILHGLSYWHRENSSIIFYHFFRSLKKSKIIHHEDLGEFIILINNGRSQEVILYNQGWFGCEEINTFELISNTEVLSKRIKDVLDNEYSYKIKMEESKNNFNQKVENVMKWDGHLDTVTRRDDKLDKLGI